MKRFALIAAVAAAALSLAPAASAKEVTELAVCGPDACNQLPKDALGLFTNGPGGTGPTRSGAAPQSYYTLRFGMGENGRTLGREEGVYFLPAAGMTRARGDGIVTEPFTALTAPQLRVLRNAARGLRPFATPAIRSIRIRGYKSAEPEAYLPLLSTLQPRPIPANAGETTRFAITWRDENPWSTDYAFGYLARVDILCRNDGCFAVPQPLAARLEREAAGFSPVAVDSFPWTTIVAATGAGATGLLAIALLLAARRRRTRRLALAAASMVAMALALAGVAAAKEVTSAALCGPDACAKLAKAKAKLFLKELHGEGEAVSSGAKLESWYRVRLGVGADETSGEQFFVYAYYLPRAGLIRVMGDGRTVEPYLRPSQAELEALRGVEGKVKPFARPQPTVTVTGRRVASAAPYTDLLGPLQARPIPAKTGKSTTIRFAWRLRSPWSSETSLTYFARVDLVCRTDGCFAVPAGVAADVERGLRAVRRR